MQEERRKRNSSTKQTRQLQILFSENRSSPDKRNRRQPMPKSLRTKTKIYSKAPRKYFQQKKRKKKQKKRSR